jgi:HlyD family secretion protein
MKKKTKKRVIISAISLVAIVLLLKSCAGGDADKKDQATKVRIEAVQTGELVEIVTAPGQIEPKRKVEISAKISARIVELPFKEGEQVKKDDLLIKLDSRDLESRLRSTEASYEGQKAQLDVDQTSIEQQKAALKATESRLEQAQNVYQRNLQLLKSQDISQATFDTFETALEEQESSYQAAKFGLKAKEQSLIVLDHNLKSAEERIEQAKQELGYTTIVSPMDGIVTRINAEVGELVMTGTMNNKGTVIMQVADLSKMLLVAEIDESDIGNLAVGQTANIRVQAYWGHIFKGVVDTIALTHSTSRSGTKYYETEILMAVDPQYQLFSGLTADVDIETLTHTNIIKVPTQAVVSRKVDDLPLKIRKDNPNVDMAKTDALVVYRLIDGKAVATPVTIGKSDMTHIIIESGIELGDQIVVGPYKELDSLKHNKKIIDESDGETANKGDGEAS